MHYIRNMERCSQYMQSNVALLAYDSVCTLAGRKIASRGRRNARVWRRPREQHVHSRRVSPGAPRTSMRYFNGNETAITWRIPPCPCASGLVSADFRVRLPATLLPHFISRPPRPIAVIPTPAYITITIRARGVRHLCPLLFGEVAVRGGHGH